MKILIVDDEPRHRRGMKNMILTLRPADLVLDAKDGAAALALIKEERPDVVLTDIRMPNMDGLEFLGMLERENMKPKVVMVSAYDRFEYAQTAMRHGAYDYLVKPVGEDKVESLLQRVEAALRAETIRDSESETLKLKLQEAASAYRKRLLLSWMNGILSEAEREELSGLDWLRRPGAIILTQFHPATGESGDSGTGALIAEMERVCGRYGPACTLPLDVSPGGGCELLTLLPWLSPAFAEGEQGVGPADEAELLRDLMSLNEAWHRRGRLCHTVGRARNSM